MGKQFDFDEYLKKKNEKKENWALNLSQKMI